MKSWFLIVEAVVAMLTSDTASANGLHESEVAEVRTFFCDLIKAFNSKDVKSVKKMTGPVWDEWSDDINGEDKIGAIDILDIAIGGMTNVTTKFTVVGGNKKKRSTEVIFSMRKEAGKYSIMKMAVPAVDKLNLDFDSACDNFATLVGAIKAKDIGKVKEALPFGDAVDFDAELTARGLSWIMDAANSDVVISGGWGVRRSGKEGFVGHIEIAHEPGGTNVLHEVIFKGMKIDRAAPRKETYEEFCKRIAAEQESARKQYNEKCAAEYKRQNAEALERLKKELKQAGVLK